MQDIYFSLDQQLANKLVSGLPIPLTIDAKNPKYFSNDYPDVGTNRVTEHTGFESDLYDLSLRSLEYAEQRPDTLIDDSSEDEELYYVAENAVNAFLQINPSEIETGDVIETRTYGAENRLGLWKKIKKYAKKAWKWIKNNAKKIFQLVKLELETLTAILEKRPRITVTNPVRVDDIYLQIKYKVRVHYKLFGRPGSIAFADNFRLPDTDLDITFKVDGLKYLAVPFFRNLNFVKKLFGFKVTIPLAWLINRVVKPMVIFDAAKYIPEIPWFGTTFTPQPPLDITTYNTGLSFGVSFKLKPATIPAIDKQTLIENLEQ